MNRRFTEYLVAILAVALAVLVRWACVPWMGSAYPFVTLFGAVAVAVWFGGIGPASVAMLGGYAACSVLFIGGGVVPTHLGDAVGLLFYLLSSVVVIGFGELLRRSRRVVQRDRRDLAASEELFRATFELSGSGQAQADPKTGRLLRVNARFCELTGYSEAELLGMTFLDLTHPDDREMSREPFRKLLRGDVRDYAIEKRYCRKDGREIRVTVNAALTRDAAGVPLRAVAVVQDVTEERLAFDELRRVEETQRLLVELHDAAQRESEPDAITWEFVRRLGEHLGADRCMLAEFDETGEFATIARDYTRGLPSMAGTHEARDFGASLVAELAAGRTVALRDVRQDLCANAMAFAEIGARSVIAVPLLSGGRLAMVLGLHRPTPHDWRADEVWLVEQVAERAWHTIERARAGALLRENRDVLSLAMRGGRMGVWSRNLDPDRIWWSRELEEIFGLEPGGFPQTEPAFLHYVHEEDRERMTSAVSDAIRDHHDYVIEFRFLHATGDWRWMEGRGRAVYDPAGRPRVLYGIGIDITDRKRFEREQAFGAAIVASSEDAIISKTLAGTITSWNAGAERLFGYTAVEAVGRPITLIIPPDRLEEEHRILTRLAEGESIRQFETVRVRKDGTLLDIALTVSPVRDGAGRVIGVSKIARDITSKKRSEQERDRLLRGERLARERAEEASRVRDEFLATVSHELRTPLSAILGWARLLREGALGEERSRYAAEVVERNAHAQAHLIEDLLDVSAIITGKMRLHVRPVMPASVVQSALDSVRPMAEAKEIRIETTLDRDAGPVPADAARLQQVVWNLLSNAIKFTPPGGQVTVGLERDDSQVEITVSDSGQGIPAEFQPHVFDRFRQADSSSTRTTSGLGLGLAIVRHLVELHGGLVRVHSAGEGRGATFSVRLPIMLVKSVPVDSDDRPAPRATSAAAPPEREAAPRLDGVRVLLVDDEPDTRALLKEVLERCGAEVRDAGTAAEAFTAVQQWKPSVLVSDIGMPGEDGYMLIRKVRDWEKHHGGWTPAMALTAYARADDRKRALLAGYQVHVAKPVEPAEFAQVVASLVLPPVTQVE